MLIFSEFEMNDAYLVLLHPTRDSIVFFDILVLVCVRFVIILDG
jgi:hypothetical protein